jgi:hypothetical protein
MLSCEGRAPLRQEQKVRLVPVLYYKVGILGQHDAGAIDRHQPCRLDLC